MSEAISEALGDHHAQEGLILRLVSAAALAAIVGSGIFVHGGQAVLILGWPMAVGALFPLLRWPGGTAWTERLENSIERGRAKQATKTGKIAKFFTRPLLGGLSFIWRKTTTIGDPHLRAGVRTAVALAFAAVMVTLLITVGWVVIMIGLTLAVLAIAAWIYDKTSNENRTASATEEAPSARERLLKTRLVTPGFLGGTPKGVAIDEDGRVVSEGLLGNTPSGIRLDESGRVVKEGFLGDTPTGVKLEEDGRIVNEGFLGNSPTGLKVDKEGRLVQEGLFGNTPAGTEFRK